MLLEKLAEILGTLIGILIMPFVAIFGVLNAWFVQPFLENAAKHGLVFAILVAVGCTLPVVLFIRWRVRLHQRKRYWRDRVYQNEPMTINEAKQMEAETYDGLAEFFSNFTIWPYHKH